MPGALWQRGSVCPRGMGKPPCWHLPLCLRASMNRMANEKALPVRAGRHSSITVRRPWVTLANACDPGPFPSTRQREVPRRVVAPGVRVWGQCLLHSGEEAPCSPTTCLHKRFTALVWRQHLSVSTGMLRARLLPGQGIARPCVTAARVALSIPRAGRGSGCGSSVPDRFPPPVPSARRCRKGRSSSRCGRRRLHGPPPACRSCGLRRCRDRP